MRFTANTATARSVTRLTLQTSNPNRRKSVMRTSKRGQCPSLLTKLEDFGNGHLFHFITSLQFYLSWGSRIPEFRERLRPTQILRGLFGTRQYVSGQRGQYPPGPDISDGRPLESYSHNMQHCFRCFIEYKKRALEEKVKFCYTPLVRNCDTPGPEECTTEYQSQCTTRYAYFPAVPIIRPRSLIYFWTKSPWSFSRL